jgi:hypothetical protein
MALMRAAEDAPVEDIIVGLLEGVTGGPDGDDWPAGFPVRADRLHLGVGKLHPAREDKEEVGILQRVHVLESFATIAAPRGGDRNEIVVLEFSEEGAEGSLGLIFLRPRDDVNSERRSGMGFDVAFERRSRSLGADGRQRDEEHEERA